MDVPRRTKTQLSGESINWITFEVRNAKTIFDGHSACSDTAVVAEQSKPDHFGRSFGRGLRPAVAVEVRGGIAGIC